MGGRGGEGGVCIKSNISSVFAPVFHIYIRYSTHQQTQLLCVKERSHPTRYNGYQTSMYCHCLLFHSVLSIFESQFNVFEFIFIRDWDMITVRF